MSKALPEIAQQLRDANKKVQLIYAFNGAGKTRLSREFKELIAPKNDNGEGDDAEEVELTRKKILYYSAFTEDLFYWDNDLELDSEPKLMVQSNTFVDWIISDRGQDQNIATNFQRYTNDKLTPSFKEVDVVQNGKKTGKKTYPEITFSIDSGTERTGSIKISKGEESNFVWSIFYTLLEEVISILEEPDLNKREDDQFNQLEYVFIDDPVSSLDENHLIELAVNVAMLVKKSSYVDGQGVRFIITTHNPLFYNVLHNELNNDLYDEKTDGSRGKCIYKRGQSEKYRLDKKADGSFALEKSNDRPFSYHLFLLSELKEAVTNGQIEKYHFNFLRNILEKSATFLGHKHWEYLLEKTADGHPDPYAKRIINLCSHSAHAGEEGADIKDEDKKKLGKLVTFLVDKYGFLAGGSIK